MLKYQLLKKTTQLGLPGHSENLNPSWEAWGEKDKRKGEVTNLASAAWKKKTRATSEREKKTGLCLARGFRETGGVFRTWEGGN